MSAKIIYTLSDENPELHKKIGCMNGICQLFEGQRFHHRRRVAGHSHHKKLPTGRSQPRKNGSEPASRALRETTEKTASRAAKEKLTVSSESSRSHDPSSWYSSSFSSAGTSQLEQRFFDNGMFQETQTHAHKTQMYQSNSPSEQSWERYGLPDVVKDSIHREARRVMIRTTSQKGKWQPKLSYIDSPRPSYDEREMRSRVRMKLQEPPRLSIDDKQQFSSLNWQQELGRRGRTSSVVVKLMGLEMLPDPISPVAETGLLSTFPRTGKTTKQNRFINSTSPRSEGATPREKVTDYQKSVVMDEFCIVPSPWKQPDDMEDSYITAPKSPRKLLNKILAQIQSTELGKGPRASRGVVKAIEKAKKVLEADDQRSGNYKFLQKSSSPASTTNIAMDSMKNIFKSQTIAMEPTWFMDESTSKSPPESHKKYTSSSRGGRKHNKKQTAEDVLNHRMGSSSQSSYSFNKNTSARPLEPTQEFSTSGKKQRNHSLQQNQLGMEEQHHQAVPLTDTSNTNTHPRGLQSESDYTIRKDRPKLQTPEQAESSVDQSKRSRQIHDTLQQSKSNRGTMRYTSNDVARKYEKFMAGDASVKHTPRQKKSAPGIRGEGLRPDPVEVVVQEQPSPVSVLDAMFGGYESPSPMKMMSRAFKDDEQLNVEEAGRALNDQKDYSQPKGINLSFEHDPDLVPANSTPEEEVIQEIAIIQKSEDTEHKYIFEILSISGILKDPESSLITTLLKPSCLPLNPDLFLALEQAKANMELEKGRDNESGQTQNAKKVKRKLIFDTVNEILAQRTILGGFSKELLPQRVVLGEKAKGHVILKTLCSEIDSLQAQNSNCNLHDGDSSLKSIHGEDLVHQETERRDSQREVPGIALDIERLIFKDLISEVVGGEIAAARDHLLRRPSCLIIL